MNFLNRFVFVPAAALAFLTACSSTTSSTGGDTSIVGTWGDTITDTAAVGGNTSTTKTELFFVLGADKSARTYFRKTMSPAGITTITSGECGSGTYLYANALLTMDVEYKSEQGSGRATTIQTRSQTTSSKVELIDDVLRLTTESDGGQQIAAYRRASLPDGITAICPK